MLYVWQGYPNVKPSKTKENSHLSVRQRRDDIQEDFYGKKAIPNV